MDNKLTQDIQAWIASPTEQRSLEEGAVLLLRLNRNRIMYAYILRTQDYSKLEYELNKHLRIRLKGLTTSDVARMERKELPLIEQTIAEGPVIQSDNDQQGGHYRGRRADHDALPADIQALYTRNGEVYFRMKQLFETLKGMAEATPCDRHELLCMLVDLDKEYRDNWNAYDTWSAAAAGMAPDKPDEQPATPVSCTRTVTPQEVSAARKYLSSNRQKLADSEGEEADALRHKMQQRVDLLLAGAQGFDPGYQQELESLGLVFGSYS